MLEDELQRREYAIHNGSSYCLKAFEHLRSSIKQSNPPSELIPLQAIEDQNGRLRAWISNIGALRIDRSSLDFRLRDVTFLADNVVKLLETLYTTLSDVKTINEEKVSQATFSEEDCHNDDESDSSSDSNKSEESSSPLPEAQQCYLLIVDVIDRLHKLSVIIKSPQLQNRSTKAENFVEKDEEGRDLTAEFEAYAIARARHQMRAWKNVTSEKGLEKDDDDLAIRIGKANSRRRRQFMYDQRYRRKFVSIEKDTTEEEQNEESAQHIGAAESPSTLKAKSSEIPASILKSFAGSTIATALSETTATEHGRRFEGISYNSSTTSSSTTYSGYQMSDVSIPEAPENEFGKGFQCPYCYMNLPAKMGKSDAWRKHVWKDLQPYICIFKGCSTQDILYDSQDTWLKHEQWEHTYQWCCNFEGHPMAMFSEENGFKDHLKKHHSETFESHQLQTLTDASKRPSLAAFSICPFCGAAPEDLVKSDHNVSVNSDSHMIKERVNIKTRDSRFVTSKAVENLQRHVASHLRQCAIMALPSRVDLNYSNSVPSTGYRQSKSDIFDISGTEIDEIEPSPFVETCEISADVPFKDNTLLWQEVFAQIPGDRRGGDLKLNALTVQPTSLTTPRASPLDTNPSTSKGKGTYLSTEWSEWAWDDRGYLFTYRTDPTGALEYEYRSPELENQSAALRVPGPITSGQQSIYSPQIELADPAYTTSQIDSIDGYDHRATSKSSFVSRALANEYYKTSGRDYSVDNSLSSKDPSNVSLPSRYSSTNETLVSRNTSWAPSKYPALSEESTRTAPPKGAFDDQLTLGDPKHMFKVPDSGDTDTLDGMYKIYGGLAQDEFWKVGRVFMMLWTEPASPRVGSSRFGGSRNGSHFSTTYVGPQAYSEIRRFVVLMKDHGNSVCCPIHTYSGQATLKPNLPEPHRHAIIHTLSTCPAEHAYLASDGSLVCENLVLDPIRVDSERDDMDGHLHPLSRLNYSKVYTVEHDVCVLNIGMVASESIGTFLQQSVVPGEQWTASSSQRPRSILFPRRTSGHLSRHSDRKPETCEPRKDRE